MARKINSIPALYIGALLVVGGLAFSTTADASTCATDQLSGICLPEENRAPAQPKAVAQGEACDQISGVCRSPENRSIEDSQLTELTADYSATEKAASVCDQLSGVCGETPTPSTKSERAQATEREPQATQWHGRRVNSGSVAIWWGDDRPIATF